MQKLVDVTKIRLSGTIHIIFHATFVLILIGLHAQMNHTLEPLCCKKWQKSPCQETGLGNKGRLKVLNDTKLVLNEPLNHLRSIGYHSDAPEVPYSTN